MENEMEQKKNNHDCWHRKHQKILNVIGKCLMFFIIISINDIIVYVFHFLFRWCKKLLHFMNKLRKPFSCLFFNKIAFNRLKQTYLSEKFSDSCAVLSIVIWIKLQTIEVNHKAKNVSKEYSTSRNWWSFIKEL